MTGSELVAVVNNRAVTAEALPELPSAEFWALAERISARVRWEFSERIYRLRGMPSATDRACLLLGSKVAEDGKRRVSRKTSMVLKLELGKLVLHYPVKRLTEDQFGVWADGYHKVLADYPDELIEEVCLAWLAKVADRMPTPADLKAECEMKLAMRKIFLEQCGGAVAALELWDREQTRRASNG